MVQEYSHAAQFTLLSPVAGPTTDMTGINPWKCFNSLYVYPNMPQLGAYTAVGTDAGKVLALFALVHPWPKQTDRLIGLRKYSILDKF